MKKCLTSKIFAAGLMMALSTTLLAGTITSEAYAATSQTRQDSRKTVGSILLSASPELKISYNKRGNVTTIKGLNKDGRDLLKNYSNYEDDSCETVVADLIGLMDDGGYLDTTVHGRKNNVVIKLSKHSQLPDDYFFDDVASAARREISDRRLDLRVISVDSDDFEPNYKDQEFINYETAKKIVKDQLNKSNITFHENDYDIDDGVYELEFTLDGVRYECDVNASTGKISNMKLDDDDKDDIRDRDDDRYDD